MRNIKCDGRIAASVLADFLTIYKDPSPMVTGAYPKYHAILPVNGYFYFSLVPNHIGWHQLPNATGFGFNRIGHNNRAWIRQTSAEPCRSQTLIFSIHLEQPGTI
jgi:hypothetical protein